VALNAISSSLTISARFSVNVSAGWWEKTNITLSQITGRKL
jgi:hypothetical protein